MKNGLETKIDIENCKLFCHNLLSSLLSLECHYNCVNTLFCYYDLVSALPRIYMYLSNNYQLTCYLTICVVNDLPVCLYIQGLSNGCLLP